MATDTHSNVQQYYGETLQSNKNLATNVCSLSKTGMPKYIKDTISLIHEDVTSRFYGCGLIAPEYLNEMSVLDLGSGSGQDCYVLSKLVGENGHITGIDMTQQQLDVAAKYIDYHAEKFGYQKPNVQFVKGFIEKLTDAGLKENSFDIIVSNCVVNLVPEKRAVLKEALKVLKVGGEFYFSDTFTDRVLSEELRKHELLWGECISGALSWKELIEIAQEEGFSMPYMVSAGTMDINDAKLKELLGDTPFVSAKYRLFKLPEKSEWLPAANLTYNGEIPYHEEEFKFDHETIFKKGEAVAADSQLVTSIMTSRFKKFFTQSEMEGEVAPKEKEAVDVIQFAKDSGEKACCPPSGDADSTEDKSCSQATNGTNNETNGSEKRPVEECTPDQSDDSKKQKCC